MNLTVVNYKQYFINIYSQKEIIDHIDITEHEVTSSATNIEVIKNEFTKFINGESSNINVNYTINASNYDKQVLKAIADIPYGSTKSYKDIANIINSPQSFRAVANACNRNKLPILIPCHRVIHANGRIDGYKYSKNLKMLLLDLEQTSKCIE